MAELIRVAAFLDEPATILRRYRVPRRIAKADTPPPSVRRVVERDMLLVQREIDKLRPRGERAVSANFKALEERFKAHLTAALRRAGGGAPSTAWWKEQLGTFIDDLELDHEQLNALATELGKKIVDRPMARLNVDAPPSAVVPVEIRPQYEELFHRWEKPMRERIKHETNLVAQGRKDYRQSALDLMGEIGAAKSDAARLVRTGVGTAHSTATQRRLEEVDAEVSGLKKRWLSALSLTTRPWHAAMHGLDPIPIEAKWEVGGPQYGKVPTDYMLHPHDPMAHPANLWNCMCASQTVVDDLQVRPGKALR